MKTTIYSYVVLEYLSLSLDLTTHSSWSHRVDLMIVDDDSDGDGDDGGWIEAVQNAGRLQQF